MQAQSELMKETFTKAKTSSVVALYNTHAEAEEAIQELQKSGFDMTKLSIVGKDYYTQEEVVGYYTTGDRMKAWGRSGAFWGGLWGLLFGSAIFVIPGVGTILAAGPLIGWIIGALESAVILGGLSVLGAGLYSIGIPQDSIIEYETQIKVGKYIVIARGSQEEIDNVKSILAPTRHEGLQGYNS